jgi:gas vesicle protein
MQELPVRSVSGKPQLHLPTPNKHNASNFDVYGAGIMKWTFFAGLGVGAAIGMVIAPKSGVELRDDVSEFTKERLNREKLESLADESRERIQSAVQQARDRIQPIVDEARQRVKPLVKEGAERVQSAADSVKKQAGPTRVTFLEVINEWPHERLIEIDGIGPVLATKIIHGRPYKDEEALTEAKTLPPSAIECLRRAA